MINVVHNIVAFGTSVIVLQALVNTFIAVQKQKTKQVSPHEGTKHKHKVNNISLRKGALFVLPAKSCAAKNLQWSQNVPVFELRVCYSRKQRFLARITKFSQAPHSYFPEDYCNVDTLATTPSQIHAPHDFHRQRQQTDWITQKQLF